MDTPKSGKLARWLLLATLLCALAAQALYAQGPKVATLAEADRLYLEKSYASALEAYGRLLQAGAVPAERKDEVRYRIAVSLGKSEKWDQALAQSLEFVKTHRGTVWEPRGLYWIGRLYLGVPHQGWKVGKKVTRGNDVPKGAQESQAEPVFLQEQDFANAVDALEAARVLFPKFREQFKTQADEIQLNFDLANLLQRAPEFYLWAAKQAWAAPEAAEWEVDPAAAYSPDWAPPRKVMFLYEQIRTLSGKTHQGALAELGKAVWLRSYQQQMQQYARKYQDGKWVQIPFPYEKLKAQDILRALVRDFPDDPVRDQAQFTLGTYFEGDGDFVRALAEYRLLIEERPKSKWVEDARHQVQGITLRTVSLWGGDRLPPGKPVTATVSYRNSKTIHFDLFRVKLEDVLARPEVLADTRAQFTHWAHNFGKIEDARRFYGPAVARWDWTTKDDGKHQSYSDRITLPIKEVGAYVLEASIPGVRAATVIIVSDLVLVEKLHRDGAILYVADAKSGKPIPDAEIVAKQWWWQPSTQHTASDRGKTNGDGVLTVPLRRAPGRTSFRLAALAWKGNRYAITRPESTWDRGDNPDTFKVHSTTDRAVYRPGQPVYYRQVLMRRQGGELNPVVGKAVHVEVRDPKGKVIHRSDQTSSEFGSVSGQLDLPSEAPLGEYYIQVTFPGESIGITQSGGNRFRVEEYKKPEFEVKVTPEAERVVLGEPTSAKVQVDYYFGGPVPNARVSYRVYRNYYHQTYHFPRPFDFLYGWNSGGDYDTYYRNGEVVSQGEAVTNDRGEAKITFETKAEGSRWGTSDLSYTVDVDVQDASRRVISGSGSVKATKHDVAVFLNYPHGYATEGDRVDVEILTLNPSNQPVSVSGRAKVYRQPVDPKGKETVVHEEALKTDRQGRAFLKWKANTSGYFRVAFETRDTREKEVSGSLRLFVQGPELARGKFLFQGVALQVGDLYYEEGQTAKLLLVTPEPDCAVLLTREANNEILEKTVVRVPGRSLELKVPLARKDVPNVYFSAVMIRNGRLLQARQEVWVPPVRQLAKISVEADKARYQPGDKARFKLLAKDWQGRPLRTELSVSVTDAALSYIQKDYAPNIQVYYYGDRRSASVPMGGSTGVGFQPHGEDDQKRESYRVHEWLLPEGMGMLADWPGDRGGYNWRYPHYFRYGLGRGYLYRGGGLADSRFAQPAERAETRSALEFDASGGIGGGLLGFGGPAAGPAGPRGEVAASKALRDAGDKASGPGDTRTHFVDTAFWTPAVVTDAKGQASVEVTWPDNLTQWRASAVGQSKTAQVGSGETQVTVRKDLLVRLQAPRFFVERDSILLSANVHNYQSRDARVKVTLNLGDSTAELMDPAECKGMNASPSADPEFWVEVPKQGEKRVDWAVRVQREGQLKVRMAAQSGSLADAAELTFPVLVHGVERQLAVGGVMRDEKQASLAIELPPARKPHSSELIVQLNPSLGATMLDALPYLVEYPYGCLEQTVSRFMPAVVVAKTLKDLGYDLAALKTRAEQLEQKEREGDKARPGGKTVANSPYSYPKGRPGTIRVSHLSRYYRILRNPVFDPQDLQRMVDEGISRVASFQRPDGGWGWWPGDSSDPYMTAYALYGLITAKESGYPIDQGMLDRGLNYLKTRYLEEDNFHRMAYEARVLAMDARYRQPIRELTTGRLFENRERLSAYSRALLAMALHLVGDREKAEVMLRNIETTAKVDEANGTANWNQSVGPWWCWWNDKVETNAAVLQAYMAIKPEAKLAPMMVKWMVNNRRANTWGSTRETAMAVYALADYVRVNKELAPEYTLTVDLGGRQKRSYTVTRENALFFDNQFIVPDELLETGANTLSLTKDGPGTLYYTAYTRYFSLEEPIKATSNEIGVERRYYRLIPGTASGTPVSTHVEEDRPNPFLTGKYELLEQGGEWVASTDTQDGPRYERALLKPGDVVTSGDLIEVELQIEAKNDYEYLVFEDLKPAGCEPVNVRSGGRSGGGLYSNMELRDQKVAFFISHLPQGTRNLTYRLRAEIPGRFHVLPTNAYAMYAPDIRALSDEMDLGVKDR